MIQSMMRQCLASDSVGEVEVKDETVLWQLLKNLVISVVANDFVKE